MTSINEWKYNTYVNMIEKIKLKLHDRVCVMRWKKNTGEGTLSSQTLYIRCLRMTPAQRAPYGWCMGDIFVQKRWSRASLFFCRGNSSCLAALIQAGWLYLHTYSNKEACRKQICFQQNSHYRTETSWCNQLRLESTSEAGVFQSPYKWFLGLQLTGYLYLF